MTKPALRRCQALASQLQLRPQRSFSTTSPSQSSSSGPTPSTMQITDHPAPHTGLIRVLSMNSPSNLNALSRQFCLDLDAQISHIKSQSTTPSEISPDSIRALILNSSLPRAFCSGADLKERRSMSPVETKEFLTGVRRTFSDLEALPIPTISAVAGYALGGGLELALCTTLRVFTSTAVVGLPETRLAIFPGAGGTYRLPRVIGLDKAREMILTGRRVGGKEAERLGVCNRLVEVSDAEAKGEEGLAGRKALEAALGLAREICEGGPVGVQQALVAVNAWERGEEGMLGPYQVVTETEDRNEALKAFGEKRKPRYQGR